MKEQFEYFLKANDAYEAFIEGLKNKEANGAISFGVSLGSIMKIACIGEAFLWSKTPQGYDYWCEVNNKWNR